MEKSVHKRTKYTCYFSSLAMASVFALPPLLFAIFREFYGISYTLLGSLVLINFCTQLGIDLIFSFFSKHFNIHKTIRLMPMLTATGLCIYALIPTLFPQFAYVGLVVGTVIFSVAAGLGEVLLSPTVAALPSDTPDKDMSMLHSLYGYGLVGVVLVSTVFLEVVGKEYWMYLTFFWAILPVIASVLFMTCQLPDMNMEQSKAEKISSGSRTKGLALCVLCIFLGACAETLCLTGFPYTPKRCCICQKYKVISSVCVCLRLCLHSQEQLMQNTAKTFSGFCASVWQVLCSAILLLHFQTRLYPWSLVLHWVYLHQCCGRAHSF